MDLPPHPDLDQLRRRAKDLLRAARSGDDDAARRLAVVSPGSPTLATAQLALAREYGFESWTRLKVEVTRREVLDSGDAAALGRLLAEDPAPARTDLGHWRDHPLGASPLGYVAMLRYDTATGIWRDVAGTADLARTLLAAGAPVDPPGEVGESPLITAASYGDAAVAQVLVEAGADLERRAAEHDGGVPGGTTLLHAAVFGMTDVVDVLVAAGAHVPDVVLAAAAGQVRPLEGTTQEQRLLALVMAAHHQRLDVIDHLVAAGTPVDVEDPVWGRRPLKVAATEGRHRAVAHLLALGADPAGALDLAREEAPRHPDDPGYAEVVEMLEQV